LFKQKKSLLNKTAAFQAGTNFSGLVWNSAKAAVVTKIMVSKCYRVTVKKGRE